MKKVFIFICIGVLSLATYAQDPDPRLFDDQWFLSSLTVDGSSINIPETDEINSSILILTLSKNFCAVDACNLIGGVPTEFTSALLTIDTWSMLFNNCFLQTTIDFEEFYFNDMYRFAETNVTLNYTLEEVSSEALRLTIVNSEGDTAVYGNPALGVQDIATAMVSLFPNPTSNKVSIALKNGLVAKKVLLYNAQGVLVYDKTVSSTSTFVLDVSNFSSGLYFVSVINTEGREFVQKLIKE